MHHSMRKGIAVIVCIQVKHSNSHHFENINSKPFIRLNPKMIPLTGQWQPYVRKVWVYVALLSTAYTTDLMLILMYGILMNVCCCFNSVLNLANGLHIETNWLRSRKKGRHLFITLHHATPLQRWTVIIFVFYGTVCCCRFFSTLKWLSSSFLEKSMDTMAFLI